MNLNNEQLGNTISRLRKQQGLTQRELGERLFVTDKTVSKWERGISMPNIYLLLPLSEALNVSTEELLRGYSEGGHQINNKIEANKKLWAALFTLALLLCILEIYLLLQNRFTVQSLRSNVLVASVLLLVFAAYFCFFALPVLPSYYDSERIGFYAHRGVRLNLPGIALNNSNWFYICRYIKASALLISLLYPLCALICGAVLWQKLGTVFLFFFLLIFVAGIYIIEKRHK